MYYKTINIFSLGQPLIKFKHQIQQDPSIQISQYPQPFSFSTSESPSLLGNCPITSIFYAEIVNSSNYSEPSTFAPVSAPWNVDNR